MAGRPSRTSAQMIADAKAAIGTGRLPTVAAPPPPPGPGATEAMATATARIAPQRPSVPVPARTPTPPVPSRVPAGSRPDAGRPGSQHTARVIVKSLAVGWFLLLLLGLVVRVLGSLG